MRTALLILMCLIAGCESAHVAQPLTTTTGGDDLDAQMEFWHQLAARPVTCNDEAFHGFLLYLDQSDPNADYGARVSELKSRGFLPGDFKGQADEAVTRGTLAVAISHALQIKGGMMMHLAPSSPRYAVRELVYMNLYPPSTPNQTFSGSEFVGIIGRVEDYQRGDNTDLPAAQLPQ
jgi:hypothetical protein